MIGGVCSTCGGSYRSASALTQHQKKCDGVDRTRRKRSRYREIFFAINGIGPYPCAACGTDVTFDVVQVHHKNEDELDDDPDNLIAMHAECHTRKHMSQYWRGKTHSEDHRQKVSAAKTGLTHSDETKKKLSEKARKRPPASAETRAKISKANKGKIVSPETRARMSAAMKQRHADKRAQPEGGGAR
jgi:hypothetical protein